MRNQENLNSKIEDNIKKAETKLKIEFYDSQKEVMRKIFEMSESVSKDLQGILTIFPTGSGKSICFQVPAMYLEGVTVVISPLLALIADQIESINTINGENCEKNGVAVLADHYLDKYTGKDCAKCAIEIDSNCSFEDERNLEHWLNDGKTKFIYVTPEYFCTDSFLALLIRNRVNVSMIVIDEAHCVSVWGNDFRPAYRDIQNYIVKINENQNSAGNGVHPIVISAFTATAPASTDDGIGTVNVHDDIILNLGLSPDTCKTVELKKEDAERFINNHPRNEMVEFFEDNNQKKHRLKEIVIEELKNKSRGMIFCLTKSDVGYVQKILKDINRKVSFEYKEYYSDETRGHEKKDRIEGIRKWYDDGAEAKILVCTSAFGMGINFSKNVDFLVNYSLPLSKVDYEQHCGRAGRIEGCGANVYTICSVKQVVGNSDLAIAENMTKVTSVYYLRKSDARRAHIRKRSDLANLLSEFLELAKSHELSKSVEETILCEIVKLRDESMVLNESPNSLLINSTIKSLPKINLYKDSKLINKYKLNTKGTHPLFYEPNNLDFFDRCVYGLVYDIWTNTSKYRFTNKNIKEGMRKNKYWIKYLEAELGSEYSEDELDQRITKSMSSLMEEESALKGKVEVISKGYSFIEDTFLYIDFFDCIVADAVYSLWREDFNKFTLQDLIRKMSGVALTDAKQKKLNISQKRRDKLQGSLKKLMDYNILPIKLNTGGRIVEYCFDERAQKGYADGFLNTAKYAWNHKNGYKHFIEVDFEKPEDSKELYRNYIDIMLSGISTAPDKTKAVTDSNIILCYYLLKCIKHVEGRRRKCSVILKGLTRDNCERVVVLDGTQAINKTKLVTANNKQLENVISLSKSNLIKVSFDFLNHQYYFYCEENDIEDTPNGIKLMLVSGFVYLYKKEEDGKINALKIRKSYVSEMVKSGVSNELTVTIPDEIIFYPTESNPGRLKFRGLFKDFGLTDKEALVKCDDNLKEGWTKFYYCPIDEIIRGNNHKSTINLGVIDEKEYDIFLLKSTENNKSKIISVQRMKNSDIKLAQMKWIPRDWDEKRNEAGAWSVNNAKVIFSQLDKNSGQSKGLLPIIFEGREVNANEKYPKLEQAVKALQAMEKFDYISNVQPELCMLPKKGEKKSNQKSDEAFLLTSMGMKRGTKARAIVFDPGPEEI